jgi:hypothetical protein
MWDSCWENLQPFVNKFSIIKSIYKKVCIFFFLLVFKYVLVFKIRQNIGMFPTTIYGVGRGFHITPWHYSTMLKHNNGHMLIDIYRQGYLVKKWDVISLKVFPHGKLLPHMLLSIHVNKI